MREALLHHPDGGRERLVGTGLVGAERQVGDDQRAAGAPRDGAHQRKELVDGHRDGRLVAEHVVRGGVADEEHGDAGLLEDGRGVLVVGGEHGETLAALLHLPQVMDAGAPRRRGRTGRGRVDGGRPGAVRGGLLGVAGRHDGSSCSRASRAGSPPVPAAASPAAAGAPAGLAGAVLAPPARDRQPPVAPERHGRRLGARRRLAALPLGPVDHRDHASRRRRARSRRRAAPSGRAPARRTSRAARRAGRRRAACPGRSARGAARRDGALVMLFSGIGGASPRRAASALRQRASSQTRVFGTSLTGLKPPTESP